ncbi:aquaporin-4-like isoform X1 [Salvelinus namaycush]|uniref:Aquaporin-4-like isoform X1 n=1 Tax=Salvelinus namaycush TaxID=8040 RepID=A0A8U1BTZ5_SALNM|nr:aquaporin-4-like isoform X1 [Salvelinus namaycush]
MMVAFKGIWTKDFWRAVSAEYLATMIFVLLSLGSTINWAAESDNPPPADLVLISFCFGLAIATMVQCFGHISGGHINPAVTAAMVVTRKLSLAKGVFYLAAQCLGAITGAGLLYLVTPVSVRGGLGVTMVNPKLNVGCGLLVELLITFELVFTVFATCDPKRSDVNGSAGLAIGFAVAIGHLFAVYWVGPILGGIMAAALYEYLFCPDPELKKILCEVFQKDPASGKYREVEGGMYQGEPDDLIIKPGSIHHIDLEKGEKKDPFLDSTGEVLSSV